MYSLVFATYISHEIFRHLCKNGKTLFLKLDIFSELQMTSNDKDFRFMATNDLMAELQKDSIKLDDDSERKVSIFIAVRQLLLSVSECPNY